MTKQTIAQQLAEFAKTDGVRFTLKVHGAIVPLKVPAAVALSEADEFIEENFEMETGSMLIGTKPVAIVEISAK